MGAPYNPEVIAQQAYSTFLKAVEAPGAQKRLAADMGVSEATVSRLKAMAEQVCKAFAFSRLTVQPVEENPSQLPPEVVKSLAVIAHHNLGGIVEQLNSRVVHGQLPEL